jgi:hypothetical protein
MSFLILLPNYNSYSSPIQCKINTLLKDIDLVLIDQQSVGKRSLHLMYTVNAKKGWTTVYCRVNKFLEESHIVTWFA